MKTSMRWLLALFLVVGLAHRASATDEIEVTSKVRKGPNGSADLPTYGYAAEPGLGWYKCGLSEICLAVNSTQILAWGTSGPTITGDMTLDDDLFVTGNLGVGTSTIGNAKARLLSTLAVDGTDFAGWEVDWTPATITATSVFAGVRAMVTNATSTTGTSGHGIGGLFRYIDTLSGDFTGYGLEGRADCLSNSNCVGVTGQVHIDKAVYTGTAIAFDAVLTQTATTGTAIGLRVPTITNFASATKYGVYVEADPSYFGGGLTTLGAGTNSTLIGAGSTASAQYGITVGDSIVNPATGGIAIGYDHTLGGGHTGSIAIGFQLAPSANGQFVVGAPTATTANITDVYIGSGVTDANAGAAGAIVYHGTGGSGTNSIGQDITIASGKSTGSASPTNINFATSTVGGSGTTLQTLATRMQLNGITNTFGTYKGADVASAAAIVPTGNVFHVTGTTSITSITATNVPAGTTLTLIFDDALTFTDGNNLKLAGNFSTSADDTITLTYDGTNFYENDRSAN